MTKKTASHYTVNAESMEQLWNDPENLNAIIDCMPGNVYWKDINGVIRGCNLNTVKYFGLKSKAEVLGKTSHELSDKKTADRIRKVDLRIMQSGKAELIEEFDPDNPKIAYLSHKLPLKNPNGEIIGIVGISFDVSERKQMELELKRAKEHAETAKLAKMNEELTGQKLKASKTVEEYAQNMRNYLEKVIDCMPGNVYWKSRDGKLLGGNKNTLEYFGLKSQKELAGKTDYELLDSKTADLVTKIDTQVMKTGNPIYNVEEPAFRKEKIVYLTQKVPLFDDDNNVIGLVGISFDITDRKKMEQEIQENRVNAQLQDEKIQAMQSIAASLAHELRTPLTTISNNTNIKEFLEKLLTGYNLAKNAALEVPFIRPSQVEAISEGLENIQEETDYANNIISMLLTNLKELDTSPSTFQEFPISEAITNMLNRYPFSSPKQKQLIHWDKNSDFHVNGKSLIITHILFNLLKNALYYLEKAGKGSITINLQPGKFHNQLIFTDTGTGISKSVLPHIFEHFFSKTENGTGIGLSFCKMAMQSLGGDIFCDSIEGEFTSFTLVFPVVTKQ